jgi:hypothetical protein
MQGTFKTLTFNDAITAREHVNHLKLLRTRHADDPTSCLCLLYS